MASARSGHGGIRARTMRGRKQVQPVPHTIYQGGVVIVQKLKVFKYIEIDGQDVPMESLTDEEKRRIAYALQDNLMLPLGFRRKSKTA